MFENSGSIGAQSPQPESRSERLTRTFKQFMEADQHLHSARQQLSDTELRTNEAREELRRAEDGWAKTSTVFAEVLTAEAPPQVQARMQQEQARWVGPIPPNVPEDAASQNTFAGHTGSAPRRW